MNLYFILNKKILLAFFPSYNDKDMPVSIEDKSLSGTESFVASSFACYYYITRLGFVSILTFYFTPRHSANI